MDYSIIPAYLYDCVIANMRAGDKIPAIRDVRVATGCGLKEATDAVEALFEDRNNLPGEPAIITAFRGYINSSYTSEIDEDKRLVAALMGDAKTRNFILDWGCDSGDRRRVRRVIGRAIADDAYIALDDARLLIKAYDRANGRNDPEKLRRLAELKREIEALEAELND